MNGDPQLLVAAIATGAAAFALNLVVIPLILLIAHSRGWYDRNDHRKIHTEDTPRLGGAGIFIAFVVLAIVGSQVLGSAGDRSLTMQLMPVFGGLTIVFLMGLIDDLYDLPAFLKLLLQISAGAMVTLGSFVVDELVLPFGLPTIHLGLLGYPVTVLWVVGLINAVNFIDGMDGLAGGAAAIAALFTAVIGIVIGQPAVTVASVALFGSVLGFLIFNFPPAKIFMGDSGSCTLGFLLAVFPLLGGGLAETGFGVVPTVTLLFVPIMDALAAVLRRIRQGVPIYKPDREHLHHKLFDLGFSTHQILAIVYGAALLSGLAAISWIVLPSLFRLLLVGGFWAAVLSGFLVLHKVRHSEDSPSQTTDGAL